MDIAAIEQAYRRYARFNFYYVCFGAVFQPGRRAIVDRMDCLPGERILEVGVGTGLSLPLYPQNVRVVGIDISRDMLDQARDRLTRGGRQSAAELMVMDAENMAFEDNSFDKVVAMYVASVVPDPRRLVDEMRRVCKPGGQIFIVNHFHSRNPILQARRTPACAAVEATRISPGFFARPISRSNRAGRHEYVPGESF